MPMKDPAHPGLSVKLDCLDPLKMSATKAAKHLGISRWHLTEVMACRKRITPDLAIRLAKAFGSSAEVWYGMQNAYDMAQALKRADEIKVERVPFEAAEAA